LLKSINPRYRAAHFGKWDLRTDLIPEDLGYDESDGNTRNSVGSEGSNFGREEKWKYFAELEDPKRIFSITEWAIRFMQRQVADGNPFYLQISHYAVHVDMQTRPETLKKYRNKKKGRLHRIPAFAGMTEDLDSGLGQLLDRIDKLGIAENTYIFYFADNGAVPWNCTGIGL
jgi:arylsulfatase A-like enzyme